MHEKTDETRQHINPLSDGTETKAQQQQSDPQRTELKGFIDPDEDLEPRLEDGTKAPEKAADENRENGAGQ